MITNLFKVPWCFGASFHTIESKRDQIDQSNDDYCHFGDFGPNVGPELWGYRAKGKNEKLVSGFQKLMS